MAWWDTIRERVGQLLGRGSAETVNPLLAHFMSQLDDEFFYARHPSNEAPVANDAIAERVQHFLADPSPPTWDRLYKIERLLVYIRPRSRLDNETDRRVAEAERQKLSGADKYRAQLDNVNSSVAAAVDLAEKAGIAAMAAPPETKAQFDAAEARARGFAQSVAGDADNTRRAILASVLDDLQWFYQQRIVKRKALWSSAWNLLGFGVISLLIVALPFLAFVYEKATGSTRLLNLIQHFPNYGLFTAMSFGLLGAFFSRLISLQFTSEMTVEDAENRYGFRSLAIRAGVGMCGAAIIYFLLGTDLLGQTAKPDFAQLSFKIVPMVTMLSSDTYEVLLPSPHWCLLVMWSFIAGFSERLVPESLARAEGQLSGTQK
jgi:hypothetical protein